MNRQNEKSKVRFDRNVSERRPDYKVGDKVYVKKPKSKANPSPFK